MVGGGLITTWSNQENAYAWGRIKASSKPGYKIRNGTATAKAILPKSGAHVPHASSPTQSCSSVKRSWRNYTSLRSSACRSTSGKRRMSSSHPATSASGSHARGAPDSAPHSSRGVHFKSLLGFLAKIACSCSVFSRALKSHLPYLCNSDANCIWEIIFILNNHEKTYFLKWSIYIKSYISYRKSP